MRQRSFFLAPLLHSRTGAGFNTLPTPSHHLYFRSHSSLLHNMSPTNGESGGEPAPKKPRLSTSPEHNVSSTSKEFNDILARKKSLRKEIRAAIKKDLNPDSIKAQSEKVWKKVFELPVYQSARSIGLFLSMPTGEINTDAILKDAMKKGKEVYVPQVGKNFEKCDMELLKVILDSERSGNEIAGEKIFHEKWPKNKWKIPEPPEDMPIITAEPGDIDLLIVPGLGFDRTRSRIGQGKGYYDRFIARMITQETPISLVAVGLTPQLVEISIPVADYDRKMDMVVLPDEVIGA